MLTALKNHALQAKFEVRTRCAATPWLAPLHQPTIWWTQWKMRGLIDTRECQVLPDTTFVIDGFQGSGNSYATEAFKSCQAQPIRLAHHLHAPAQIIKAVQQGVPVLVTLRHPSDAVVSLVSRWPYVGLGQGLRAYIRFYEALTPYLDRMVVSPFAMTTGPIDIVFTAVNDTFGCDFAVFTPSAENVARIRSKTTLTSAAEAARRQEKADLRAQVAAPRFDTLRQRAERIHAHWQQHGVSQPAASATA